MAEFRRALGVTLSVIILVLVLIFAFELVNQTVSKSGFSSGEVLVFEFEKNVFSGEFLGGKFSFDFSPAFEILPVLENFALLLPPCSQLLLRLLVSLF